MPAELARAWQLATAALIEDAIPGDTEPPETWRVCAALLPHAQQRSRPTAMAWSES